MSRNRINVITLCRQNSVFGKETKVYKALGSGISQNRIVLEEFPHIDLSVLKLLPALRSGKILFLLLNLADLPLNRGHISLLLLFQKSDSLIYF